MRINDERGAGGVSPPLRLGMALWRRKAANPTQTDDERPLQDTPPVARFTVYRALRGGLAFSLGQPIHLFRLTALPILAFLASLFLFVTYHMAYMAFVPDQFGPFDWLRAAFAGFLFLWAWTTLWGGLFGHFFGKQNGPNSAPAGGRGANGRLLLAFAVLWSVPLSIGALVMWGNTVFRFAQLASADIVLPAASYQPRPLGQEMDFLWPLVPVGGIGASMITMALVLFAVFLLVRLGFLIPDAVSSGRLSPFRVWRQTQGLFWPTIGLFLFSLPALLMLLGGPTTLGIFATYYLYPDLLAEDVKITLVAREVWDLLPLWPTFVGGAVGLSFCAAFWTAAFGTLYRSRVST